MHCYKFDVFSSFSYWTTIFSGLVVTSGGLGDGKLLLWNALTGELTADLNGSLRYCHYFSSFVNLIFQTGSGQTIYFFDSYFPNFGRTKSDYAFSDCYIPLSRSKSKASPSIEAMEFYNQNLLVCGSDSSHGGPAVVQLWDIESPESYLSIPANDSVSLFFSGSEKQHYYNLTTYHFFFQYITSLKTNSDCNTVITGELISHFYCTSKQCPTSLHHNFSI